VYALANAHTTVKPPCPSFTHNVSIILPSPSYLPPSFSNSLAHRLLLLIPGPHRCNTHGTTVNATPTAPKKLPAPPNRELPGVLMTSNNLFVNRGKAPPRRLRQKDWAAMAELA